MALAVTPQGGIGQERGRSASPAELWHDYPLMSGDEAGGAGVGAPVRTQPAVQASGDVSSAHTEDRPDRIHGVAPAWMVLLGVVAVGVLALVVVLGRRGGRALLRRPRSGRSPPDPPVGGASRTDPRPSPRTWADLRDAAWTAEIQWRSQEGASRFCVVASPPGGEGEMVLMESPYLEWPPRSDDAVEALVGAVADLGRSVVAAGWETTEPATAWFGKRFVWARADRPPERRRQSDGRDIVRMEERGVRSR